MSWYVKGTAFLNIYIYYYQKNSFAGSLQYFGFQNLILFLKAWKEVRKVSLLFHILLAVNFFNNNWSQVAHREARDSHARSTLYRAWIARESTAQEIRSAVSSKSSKGNEVEQFPQSVKKFTTYKGEFVPMSLR